jgi:hypothetical protein
MVDLEVGSTGLSLSFRSYTGPAEPVLFSSGENAAAGVEKRADIIGLSSVEE